MSLRLTLLGPPSLRRTEDAEDGSPILGPGKPLAVLAILAISPGRSATRDHLIDQLWGDVARESARHTLRQTLWYIRRRAGEILALEGDVVRLVPDVTTDRDEFLLALESQDDDRAVALYGGEFFPSYAAPGGAQFEQTAEQERQRLRTRFLAVASAQARRDMKRGHAREAHALAQRLRTLAPLDQRPWRLLLESLVSLGDDAAAAAELEAYRAWCLHEEEPVDEALVALVRPLAAREDEGRTPPAEPAAAAQPEDAAGGGSAESAGSVVAPGVGDVGLPPVTTAGASPRPAPTLITDLIGRDRALAALLDAWRTVRRGRGRHVHIVAETGLGKTRLLDGFGRRLQLDRHEVRLVRARQSDRAIPFALAADVAAVLVQSPGSMGVSEASARLLVDLAPSAGAWLRVDPDRPDAVDALRRRTLAIEELVSAVAEEQPVALLVDDLHWADDASRAVLARLAALRAREPFLLVTAARAGTQLPTSADDTLELSPLTPDDIDEIVRSLGELPVLAWAELLPSQLHAASGGVPLVVVELLQLARARGLLLLEDHTWLCPEPARLASLFTGGGPLERLIDQLDADELALLRTLALLAVPVVTTRLADAAGRDVRPALERLEARGLADGHNGQWRIAHDEIADVVRARADQRALRAAHAMAGRVVQTLMDIGDRRHVYGVRHAVGAGERERAVQELAALIVARHAVGDATAQRAITREALDVDSDTAEVRALVRALPWRVRRNPVRVAAVAGVIVATLLLAAAVLFSRPALDAEEAAREPTYELLVAARDADGEPRLLRFAFDDDDLGDQDREATLRGAVTTRWSAAAIMRNPQTSLVPVTIGDTLHARLIPDPAAGNDLYRIAPGATEPELVAGGPGDQYEFAMSPDGRYALLQDADIDRFGQFARALVLMETGTRRRRAATGFDAHHARPVWDALGARFAFLRHASALGDSTRLCTTWLADLPGESAAADTTTASLPRRCTALSVDTLAGLVTSLLAWAGPDALLALTQPVSAPRYRGEPALITDAAPPTSVVELAPDGRVRRTVELPACIPASAPPSGRVLLCGRSAPFGVGHELLVVSTNDARRTIRLAWPDGRPLVADPRFVTWRRGVRPSARIAIDTGLRRVSVGDHATLRAFAGTGGAPRLVSTVRWRSLDPAIAEVNDAGRLTGVRIGDADIEVALSDLARDTMRVRVERATWTTLLEDRWAGLDDDRWLRFGLPPFTTDDDGDPPTLVVTGDGIGQSGIMSRRTFTASGGIGVEFRLRLPLTRTWHQALSVSLMALNEEIVRRDLDSLTGDPEFIPETWSAGLRSESCVLGVPAGEGAVSARYLALASGPQYETLDTRQPSLTDGRWHTVRLQFFDDGECGLAIDGTLVSVAAGSRPPRDALRLLISGSAVDTDIRLGTLTVWSGVREGVDWSARVSRPAATASGARD